MQSIVPALAQFQLPDLGLADALRPSIDPEFIDRRCEARHMIHLPVTIIVDDPVLRSMDNAEFEAITRDISPRGIGLISPRPITAERARVRVNAPSGSRLTLLIEILRCRSLGPFFDIGGRFVFPG